MKQLVQVNKAFSKKSRVYDQYSEENIIVNWTRKIVYSHVLKFLKPEDKILEINSGTGSDALFFAEKGYKIHATDISKGMLRKIAKKGAKINLDGRLTHQRLSFTNLQQVKYAPYNYIFSNFGGINCIPDLFLIIRSINESILIPGSYMTWVIMPPICPWELLNFPWNFRSAFRRIPSLWSRETKANIDGEKFFSYYYSPKKVMKTLGSDFKKISLQSLSLFSPPSFMELFPVKYPKLYRKLIKLDIKLTPYSPFNNFGDFYILTVQYLPKKLCQN